MSIENLEFKVYAAVDEAFLNIMREVQELSVEKVNFRILRKFKKLNKENRKRLGSYYSRHDFWGRLDESAKDYSALENRGRMLHDHCEDLLWLYSRLEDYRSRYVLYAFINNWYNFGFSELINVSETFFRSYFDLDIMKCGPDEVLVDLGSYDGDTVIDYLCTYGINNYKKIYCYEITPSVIEKLKDKLKGLPNIVIRQKGASDCKGMLCLNEKTDKTANVLSDNGTYEVETVSIDEDIEEPVTFIKMDIEGSEKKAMLGCARHIRASKPKLAISVYHDYDDIWKIARIIDEICPGYKFYLRYHGGGLIVTEATLLAVYEEPK